MISGVVAQWTGLNADHVVAQLHDTGICPKVSSHSDIFSVQPRPLLLGEDGYPVSNNKVWNLCVRGKATLADIRSNPDVVLIHRHTVVHKSCDAYRYTASNEWKYPDDPFLTVTINSTADKPLVSVPSGYAVVPAESTVAAK